MTRTDRARAIKQRYTRQKTQWKKFFRFYNEMPCPQILISFLCVCMCAPNGLRARLKRYFLSNLTLRLHVAHIHSHCWEGNFRTVYGDISEFLYNHAQLMANYTTYTFSEYSVTSLLWCLGNTVRFVKQSTMVWRSAVWPRTDCLQDNKKVRCKI